MNTTFYFDAWKRFVKEGVLDSARLNKRILESWHRCKKEKVNPYLNKGLDLLSKEELLAKKEKHTLLIEVASPYIKKMDQAIKDTGMMALLVDPDGYVLSLTGNEKTLSDAKKINFVEGVRWTETEVGTNAIGTAIQTKEAVTINGAEHYSVASHQWSCSATPIFHDNGSLMGVIDVSCPVNYSHPFMLGMVTSISYAIEKELNKRSYLEEIALFQQASQLGETYQNRLYLVCDHNQMILFASKSIRERFPKSIGMKLNEFLHNGYQIDAESPFLSKENNRMIGSCYFLSEVLIHRNRVSFHSISRKPPFIFKGERGTSEVFQHTINKVKLVAPTDATVLITGETGTGKELIARAIHDNSHRKDGPFVSLNCGAIPKDLMESELFGYVEGAFTGARRQGFKGKFEQAQKGTLFLDEIGEISHSMQVALLRVLQERKVTPLGGTKEIPVDVRIIAATHRDMTKLVVEEDFRDDLYYRLNVYPIDVPPLRKRKEDIPHLVRYFCKRNGWNLPNIDQLISRLQDYEWPGNIRELLNSLERLHILSQDQQLSQDLYIHNIESLIIRHPSTSSCSGQENLEETEKKLKAREKIQRDLMLEALKKTKGNVTAAAKLLEIPRSTFYKRLQRFGI